MHTIKTLTNSNLKYIAKWARKVGNTIEMKNAYTGLVGRNWNKEPLAKDVHLGGRIIFKPIVNENIHLAWTYWHRIKVVRTLGFQEIWGIS
jgi:hypothetical protein